MARMLDDLPFLHAALVLRHKGFVASPQGVLGRVAAFLGVPVAEAVRE